MPGQPPPARPPPRGRARRWPAAIIIAAGCLAVAVTGAVKVHAELVRKPTAAELSRAAAAAVTRRWLAWPTGKIFPAALPYTAELDVPERATRVGIGAGSGCAMAVGPAVAAILLHNGCRGVLRASYVDEREAVVITIGVAAFPSPGAALAAQGRLRPDPAAGLHALAIPYTASASFSDPARQADTVTRGGPYLVLTTAGYADGRPAAATGETRPAVFAPAAQLAQAILAPLAAPAVPRCGAPGWTC